MVECCIQPQQGIDRQEFIRRRTFWGTACHHIVTTELNGEIEVNQGLMVVVNFCILQQTEGHPGDREERQAHRTCAIEGAGYPAPGQSTLGLLSEALSNYVSVIQCIIIADLRCCNSYKGVSFPTR